MLPHNRLDAGVDCENWLVSRSCLWLSTLFQTLQASLREKMTKIRVSGMRRQAPKGSVLKEDLAEKPCAFSAKSIHNGCYAQLRITAIRALIKRKKRYPSDFFKPVLPATFPTSSQSDANLRFRLSNQTFARALARRGGPFSQPSGSSALPADLRPPLLGCACDDQPCAHPAAGGTRKLSVPGRVHSV